MAKTFKDDLLRAKLLNLRKVEDVNQRFYLDL